MTEGKYMNKELEDSLRDAGTYYKGMRQLLESPEMPEDVRGHAGHYALALMAAREHDALPKTDQYNAMHPRVMRMLISHALAQTPLKDIPEERRS